ncbi:MAG: aldehyde dehydrogenase family protein [Cyanobacteria bacterium P01_F01_bin.143]
MKATEAIANLNPQKWSKASAIERLHLLEEVRENLKNYGQDLATADARMKNDIMGEALFSQEESMVATVLPVANTLSGCIDLYESLIQGEMLKPLSITKVKDGLYDIHVFPQSAKDKLLYSDRKDVLRVKGKPKQINPLNKPGGIIAVLGAGNYSSSLEMLKAIFLENCAVVHKPHHLNEDTDRIWAKIMKPLVEYSALSFCYADQGRALTKDERLHKIYFTGGSHTAQAIMNATDTELVSECGGNNPCIIVPGDRPWTEKELHHQALQIATVAKLNGGAVCGRTQTLVTSKHWPQRKAFLIALRQAIVEDTPAAGTYYPGSDKVLADFKEHYPNAEVLKPEGGKYQSSDFMVMTDIGEDGYGVTHEAFCQIMGEVALDVPANAAEFLPKAVEFCNSKLLGTLGSCILIDGDTQKAHSEILAQAVTNMEYGGIAVNTIPPFIFFSPYLTWGGNEEGKAFVSGHGNFGNLLCYENVEKSIIFADFMSPGHMINTNKSVNNALSINMVIYGTDPTWMNLTKLITGALVGGFKKKDF